MATLILTAVGSAIGGPIGGALGAVFGQRVDQAIFGGGGREGPRLKELAVTTSSYGQPIARNFGRMRVAGTVVWSTELIETTSKEGGGKGRPSTTTYSYSASFAVALSSTPIERLGRIWADGNLLRGASGDLKVAGEMRLYRGTGDSPIDPLIAAERGSAVPGFRDCAYVVFEDLQLADYGNRIPALTFEIFAPRDASVSLDQLVPQATSVSGDLLLRNARGFSDEGGPVGNSLGAIDRVFPLVCVTAAEGLRLSSAAAIIAQPPTLPEQLSARDSEEAQQHHSRRGDSIGKEPLALRYYDEGRDYQPGVQRALGLRPEGREAMVDLPATMTAEGARELANSNAHRARWRDENVTWRVGELDPRIAAGSIVKLPDRGGFWRIRSWEWFDRGIELVLDRVAPELGAVVASDAGSANSPADIAATPSILRAFEVPGDETSNPLSPIVFAATSSVSAGWRGAALFVDQNGSLIGIGSASGRRAISGSLAAPLTGSAGLLFEPEASIEIDLPSSDLGFEATDMTGLAMGANRLIVGGEVMQFLHAEPSAGDRWLLTGLLRGRAGTEDAAIQGHDQGEFAILLDDRLTAIDVARFPALPGTRIAAIGRGDPQPVYADIRNVGLSRRPPMPIAPRRVAQGDGAWLFHWTRRARGHWRWPDESEVPLVEEREAYTVGYGASDTPFVSWSLDEPSFTLSSAQRIDLLGTHGAHSLWVRQVGTFGRSSPLMLGVIT